MSGMRAALISFWKLFLLPIRSRVRSLLASSLQNLGDARCSFFPRVVSRAQKTFSPQGAAQCGIISQAPNTVGDLVDTHRVGLQGGVPHDFRKRAHIGG